MAYIKLTLASIAILISTSAFADNFDSMCKNLVSSLLQNKISLNIESIKTNIERSAMVKADFLDNEPTSLTYRCDFIGDKITLYPVRNDAGPKVN